MLCARRVVGISLPIQAGQHIFKVRLTSSDRTECHAVRRYGKKMAIPKSSSRRKCAAKNRMHSWRLGHMNSKPTSLWRQTKARQRLEEVGAVFAALAVESTANMGGLSPTWTKILRGTPTVRTTKARAPGAQGEAARKALRLQAASAASLSHLTKALVHVLCAKGHAVVDFPWILAP